MKYKLIAEIASSLLFARWRQSLVAAVGVMFSITMFIALLGFMNGLNDMLDGLVLNRTPHVRLFNEIKPNPNQPIDRSPDFNTGHNFIQSIKSSGGRLEIYNSAAIVTTVSADPRVKGLAPKITAPVLYNAGSIDITGVVSGIDVVAENKLFSFADYVTSGNTLDLKNVPNSIVLGIGVAQKLLAQIGDVIQITTAKGDQLSLKVVGIFESGVKDLDKVQSYASIATAQKLLDQSNTYITDLQINLKDLKMAPCLHP
jgi:lipoprotein-releasing system permease protein